MLFENYLCGKLLLNVVYKFLTEFLGNFGMKHLGIKRHTCC
jgi:hypothetical protein